MLPASVWPSQTAWGTALVRGSPYRDSALIMSSFNTVSCFSPRPCANAGRPHRHWERHDPRAQTPPLLTPLPSTPVYPHTPTGNVAARRQGRGVLAGDRTQGLERRRGRRRRVVPPERPGLGGHRRRPAEAGGGCDEALVPPRPALRPHRLAGRGQGRTQRARGWTAFGRPVWMRWTAPGEGECLMRARFFSETLTPKNS